MKVTATVLAVSVAGMTLCASVVSAQTAGAGAEHNRAERAKAQEIERLEKVDPPVRPDPLGNALIGGAVTGTMKGAAAGAASAARSGAIGATVQGAKDSIERNRVDNSKTGRGSDKDPRYDPRSLIND